MKFCCDFITLSTQSYVLSIIVQFMNIFETKDVQLDYGNVLSIIVQLVSQLVSRLRDGGICLEPIGSQLCPCNFAVL